MNNTILKFLKKHDINMNVLKKKCELGVKSSRDVNDIVHSYFIGKDEEKKKVYIANIVGYNYNTMRLDNTNIIDNMSYFYDEDGTSYSTRSLNLLNLSTDEVVYRLSDSFTRDPIYLLEADKGKFVIDSNGLHRLHVLKAHYLKELSELDKKDTMGYKILKDKYTIETVVRQIDFTKTYAWFLLQRLAMYYDSDIDIRQQYNNEGKNTGNVFVELNGEKSVLLSEKQLVNLLRNEMSKFLKGNSFSKLDKTQFIDYVNKNLGKYASFKEFFKQNLQEIYNEYFYDGEVEVN